MSGFNTVVCFLVSLPPHRCRAGGTTGRCAPATLRRQLTAFGLVIALAWIVMRINRQIEERLGLDGD